MFSGIKNYVCKCTKNNLFRHKHKHHITSNTSITLLRKIPAKNDVANGIAEFHN